LGCKRAVGLDGVTDQHRLATTTGAQLHAGMQPLQTTRLDERYGRLRIVHPVAHRAVRDSMHRRGQLMPIVACERDDVFAVVDGFKRLAAARELGLPTLLARVMLLAEAPAMAALVTFNRPGRGLSDLEEALVVRALCREQSLSQVEVAELVGRHKSWVCRRLSLAERLSQDVTDDVRAGLISSTVARELARLPRGNQGDLSSCIRQHGLTSREAALVVTLFTQTPAGPRQRALLDDPRTALQAQRPGPAPIACDPRLGPVTQRLHQRLCGTLRTCADLQAHLTASTPSAWSTPERQVLLAVLTEAQQTTARLARKLDEVAQAARSCDVQSG
jgi:ParB/RepB/Spo0J family partition protein